MVQNNKRQGLSGYAIPSEKAYGRVRSIEKRALPNIFNCEFFKQCTCKIHAVICCYIGLLFITEIIAALI